MKPARLIVLVLAIAAGGIAALLAGYFDYAPPAPSAPGAQPETAVSVIVPTGMRAGSTDISSETGAGGSILPNAAPAPSAGSPAAEPPPPQ
jgi:Flp pilus assembly protein CpaB